MLAIVIISLILSLVCLGFSLHVSNVYCVFNKNIREWSRELDNSTRDAINRSARDILRELDEKVNNLKQEKDDAEND